ncbi:MAG: site-specific integrase [Bacteroidetes bacterium]|nr:site-specific integrase [Bacteroidota bacterium]
MAKVNFYLKDPASSGDTLIFLFFAFEGSRLKYSTGETIKPSHWNANTMRVKKSVGGSTDINDWLDKIQSSVKEIYRTMNTNGELISSTILRDKLDSIRHGKKERLTLFAFIETFIDSVTSSKKVSTISVYRTTVKHLLAFEKYSRQKLDFESMNLDFYNDFSDYLIREKGFSTNSIGKYIKTIKVFLNEATDRGINQKLDFKSKRFKVTTEDTESIYLNEAEIQKLNDLSLKDKIKLERVRDLFIVGCYTGLRFSDFTQIKAENIKDGYFNIRTQKTDEFVSIPIHPMVKAIMMKYENEYLNSLPPAISNQKMNEHLKKIGEMAELNDDVITSQTKGTLRVETKSKKYELITTHTARRSFATNLYLSGFPAISIMKITGHKTEKAFLRYIKMKPQENAMKLKKFWSDSLQN